MSNEKKNTEDWVTGNEPITGAQASYLETLAEETGTDIEMDLSKAEASRQIDALQQQSTRLKNGHDA